MTEPQQQHQHQHRHHHHHHPMSVSQWAGILLLTCIPVVGLATLIVNSLSKKEGNKRNFSRAALCIRITFDIIAILMAVNGILPTWNT